MYELNDNFASLLLKEFIKNNNKERKYERAVVLSMNSICLFDLTMKII